MRLTLLAPFLFAGVPGLLGMSCEPGGTQQAAGQATNLAVLSDEFDDPASIKNWQRVDEVEGWNANQLERFDVGKTQAGWMTMVPYASTWYRDYRGVMAFKQVTGDFVVTTRLHVSQRGGNGAPRSQFSLAGIMVRTPRKVTPATWQPGGENYNFLSLGAADRPGNFQFEVKTTVNSDSQLEMTPAPSGDAIIRVARVGASMIMLKKVGGQWSVHKRYNRPDMPATLQVGLTCYTDWPTASQLQPKQQNGTVIRNGNPDLVASFDYVRFTSPNVPKGKRVDDASDAEILRWMGEG